MKKNHFKLNQFIFIFAILFLLIAKVANAGTLLVGNVLSNSVTLFDDATLQTKKEVSVGFRPHEIVTTSDGKLALVANFGDLASVFPGHSLSVIDVAKGSLVNTILLPENSRPHGIALLSDTEALVTAQGIKSLLLVDIVRGIVTKTIPLPNSSAHMVKVDAAKRYAYIANVDTGSVAKMDLKNYSVIGEIKIGKEAEGLALTPEEDLLFVTDRKDNYIGVVRTKDLSLQKKIPTSYGPVRVVLFNNGHSAVVITSVSGKADIIDVDTLTLTHSFKTTDSFSLVPSPINVLVRDDQKTAFITNFFACTTTLLDLVSGRVLNTLKGGYMPDGIALSAISVE